MYTIEDVLELKPCNEARKWLKSQQNLESAWEICQRGDWMIWVLTNANLLTKKDNLAIQLAILETPIGDNKTVLSLITDERSLAFIEIKREKLRGVDISAAAWAAAWAAARDAAARDAAWAAAWDATNAANAAARAAARATTNVAAWDAANAAAWAWIANKIRELITNPSTRT